MNNRVVAKCDKCDRTTLTVKDSNGDSIVLSTLPSIHGDWVVDLRTGTAHVSAETNPVKYRLHADVCK